MDQTIGGPHTGVADVVSVTLEKITARLVPPWQIIDWSQGPLSWRSFSPSDIPLPHQGWKIHVSAAAIEAAELYARIAPVLDRLAASFKVPRSLNDVVFINSGDGGAALMGKVVTIYPTSDAHAADLVSAIDAVWPVSRGPEVRTDLHLKPGSAVSLRYAVFGTGPIVTSSSGVHHFALIAPDGSLVGDTRPLDGRIADWIPPPPVTCAPSRPRPVILQRTLSLNGARYVPLMELSDKPTVRILLAVAADSLDTVVVKVGYRGAGGDAHGRDVSARLKKEFEILQRLASHPNVAPKPLQWSDGEWPIAVLEDFRGDLLSELPRPKAMALLPALARTVAAVHEAGIVHGDLKLENAVERNDAVGLIDFELAERAGDPVGPGGTSGHMGPEVAAGTTAHFARDIFALGACVPQAVLGIPPGLLPAGTGRLEGLLQLEGASAATRLLKLLCQADPGLRPSAAQAVDTIAAQAEVLQHVSPAAGLPSTPADLRWCRRASHEAASLVHEFSERGGDGEHWRNAHFMSAFPCEAINIGAAGIILGLATIDAALERRDFDGAIRSGAEWLSMRRGDDKSAGLFTGNAGVALALAVAARRLENDAYNSAAMSRLRHAAADNREVDLFSGTAGVLFASCLISTIVGAQWPLDMGRAAAGTLARRFNNDSDVPSWSIDARSDTHYLGCAHGAAGIAMALACWGRQTGDRTPLDLATETFQRIFTFGRTPDGRALRMTVESERAHAAGTWCHGVAGYLWCILQAFGDSAALRGEIDWAVGAVSDSMTVGTPTYCHGLAGRLELWRMVGQIPRFRAFALAQAGKTARALRLLHQKVKGRIAWCSDDPSITTPDLWIGFLGPASALAMHAAGRTDPLLSPTWLGR